MVFHIDPLSSQIIVKHPHSITKYLTATITTSIRFVHGKIDERKKNAPKSFPRDGTTRVQSFSVDEYFCAPIMTVFGGVCVLTRNVFTCGGSGVVTAVVYTNKLRCAVYIRLNFCITPLLRVPVCTYAIYIYIYTHLDQKLLWAQVSACPLA